MSTDLCEIFFSTLDPNATSAKARNRVEKIFSKHGLVITNLSHGKKRDEKRDKVVQIEAKDTLSVLEECLKIIDAWPSNHPPYARYLSDQAGHTIYFGLCEGELAEFEALEDYEYYLNQNPLYSPELEFEKKFSDASYLALMRLKIPGKKFRSQLKIVCDEYIASPSDEEFSKLGMLICESNIESGCEVQDINDDWIHNRGDINVDVPRSLCFCEEQDIFLFLGFNSIHLSESVWRGFELVEDVLNTVGVFGDCKRIKDSRARVWALDKNSKYEWCSFDVPSADYNCIEYEKRSLRLWNWYA